MLPPTYTDTPFPHDFFKTCVYLQHQYVVKGMISSGRTQFLTWADPALYKKICDDGVVDALPGVSPVKVNIDGVDTYCLFSVTLQLAGQDKSVKIHNIMQDIVWHINNSVVPSGKRYSFATKSFLRGDAIICTLSDVSLKVPTKDFISLNIANSEPQPVGSTKHTGDTQSPQSMPADAAPQVSNQQEVGVMPIASLAANNRMAESGQLIQITELITKNWQPLMLGGTGVISVPVDTAAGTVLWSGTMYDMLTPAMQAYANLHVNWYPAIDLEVNYVGTPTWAGNLRVSVTPVAVPTTATFEQREYFLTTYAWEQHPLSINGAQAITLHRLINSSQSNVGWDTVTANSSSGPYVYITLVTEFQQALANSAAAFQFQIFARYNSATSFGGINWENIYKSNAAITSVAKRMPSLDVPLSFVAGMSFKEMLKLVLGQSMPHDPQLILNGAFYFTDDFRQDDTGIRKRAAFSTLPVTRNLYRPTSFNMGNNAVSPIGLIGTSLMDIVNSPSDCFGWYEFGTTDVFNAVTFQTVTGFSSYFLSDLQEFLRSTFGITWKRSFLPSGIVPTVGVFSASDTAAYVSQYTYNIANVSTENIQQYFASLGYSICHSRAINMQHTFFYNLADIPSSSSMANGPATYFRVARGGIVDEFVMLSMFGAKIPAQAQTARAENTVTVMQYLDDVPRDYETVYQVQVGNTMPTGWYRFEIAMLPVPIASKSTVPSPMFSENAAFLQFINDKASDDYYLSFEVFSNLTGKRAFTLLYAKQMATFFINFNRSIPSSHQVFTGASLDDLQIRTVSNILKTQALTGSDIGLWSDIVASTTAELPTALARLTRNTRRRRKPIKPELEEQVFDAAKAIFGDLVDKQARDKGMESVGRMRKPAPSQGEINSAQVANPFHYLHTKPLDVYQAGVNGSYLASYLHGKMATSPQKSSSKISSSIEQKKIPLGSSISSVTSDETMSTSLPSSSFSDTSIASMPQTFRYSSSNSSGSSSIGSVRSSLSGGALRNRGPVPKQFYRIVPSITSSSTNSSIAGVNPTTSSDRTSLWVSKVQQHMGTTVNSTRSTSNVDNQEQLSKFARANSKALLASYEWKRNASEISSVNPVRNRALPPNEGTRMLDRARLATWERGQNQGRPGSISMRNPGIRTKVGPSGNKQNAAAALASAAGSVSSSVISGLFNLGTSEMDFAHNQKLMNQYFNNLTTQQKLQFQQELQKLQQNFEYSSSLQSQAAGESSALQSQKDEASSELSAQEAQQNLALQNASYSSQADLLEKKQSLAGYATGGLSGLSYRNAQASSPSGITSVNPTKAVSAPSGNISGV